MGCHANPLVQTETTLAPRWGAAAAFLMDAPGTDPGLNNPMVDGVDHVSNKTLIDSLAAQSRDFDSTGRDPERNCWLVVHRHVHGVLPSEYDIREVPEELYLAVLAARRDQEC